MLRPDGWVKKLAVDSINTREESQMVSGTMTQEMMVATQYKTLNLKIEKNILYLTIQRPEALNALNAEVMSELGEVFLRLEKNHDVRVVILAGSGDKAFVAGADIKEIDKLGVDEARGFAAAGQALFTRIERSRVPVIAAVSGFALGGGLELALACDFIVASDKSKMGLPECSLGIMPGYGGTVRLPRRVGSARAKEMILTGQMVTAVEALQMGLVNRVVEPDKILEACVSLADAMLSRAPQALSKIKQSINFGLDMSVDQHNDLEAQLFSQLFATQDQKEGTRAFIEKRKPIFSGH